MALFLRHQEKTYQWGIWKTDEAVDELLALLPGRDYYEQELQHFVSPRRKLEWLSVRVLLYTLLNVEKRVAYYPSGKPYLEDGSYSISISHTRGYVAVVLSKVAGVGIDIEQYGQRIHNVAHKFMRSDEVPTIFQGEDTWSLLLHWSAKEVMFKCLDTPEVDFCEHLHINPFTVQNCGEFNAKEYRTPQQHVFHIHYMVHPEFVMTWQIDN